MYQTGKEWSGKRERERERKRGGTYTPSTVEPRRRSQENSHRTDPRTRPQLLQGEHLQGWTTLRCGLNSVPGPLVGSADGD